MTRVTTYLYLLKWTTPNFYFYLVKQFGLRWCTGFIAGNIKN